LQCFLSFFVAFSTLARSNFKSVVGEDADNGRVFFALSPLLASAPTATTGYFVIGETANNG